MKTRQTCTYVRQARRPWGKLTLSLLGSSLRTQSVHRHQRSFKASRRVRTTLIQHVMLGMRGVPDGSHALHRLGLPSWKATHAVSRWRRKPYAIVPILLLHPSHVVALTIIGHTQAENMTSTFPLHVLWCKSHASHDLVFLALVLATHAARVFDLAVGLAYTVVCPTISDIGLTTLASDVEGSLRLEIHSYLTVEARFLLMPQLTSFHSDMRNFRLLPKQNSKDCPNCLRVTSSLSHVHVYCCSSVAQPHTTKSLTGGVLNTWASAMLASVALCVSCLEVL